MNPATFAEFETDALRQGYETALERQWAPLTELEAHVHPFAAKAVVVQGEMWLTVGDDTRRLLPGDTFELDANVSHAERYGAAGATYWVARRNA